MFWGLWEQSMAGVSDPPLSAVPLLAAPRGRGQGVGERVPHLVFRGIANSHTMLQMTAENGAFC